MYSVLLQHVQCTATTCTAGRASLWQGEFLWKKIVAAFWGMHVSPAKHSSASVTDGQTDIQTDRQTDGRTDRRRTKWFLCVPMLCRWHKNCKIGGNWRQHVQCTAGWASLWGGEFLWKKICKIGGNWLQHVQCTAGWASLWGGEFLWKKICKIGGNWLQHVQCTAGWASLWGGEFLWKKSAK